jgi:hypothetical protein
METDPTDDSQNFDPWRVLWIALWHQTSDGSSRRNPGCRRGTADLINMNGTEVCLPLKDEKVPRRIRSSELSGRLDAKTPEMIDPSDYDLVVLAMQEPHYLHHAVRALLKKKAAARGW